MHPGGQEETLSFVQEEEGEEEAQQLEDGVFSAGCPTPHEALSLSWPPADDHPQQEAPSRPASPTPLEDQPQDEDHPALDALPPALPALPPLEITPLGGPLTRSFSNYLQDDSKFFRPISAGTAGGTLKSAATSAPKPVRRIVPTALPSSSSSSSSTRFKRPRASESLATTSAPAPPPAPAPVLAAAAVPAPRKKRRGMRPGTYMCLYKGELYECPHGCDIVEKGLLYDLLRR